MLADNVDNLLRVVTSFDEMMRPLTGLPSMRATTSHVRGHLASGIRRRV